jgi:osmotically-inducible protein OsmY
MENRERYEPRERGGDGNDYDERERRRWGRQARREFAQDDPAREWSQQDYGYSSGRQSGGYGSYRGGQGYGEESSQFNPYGGRSSGQYFGHGSELGQHQGWGQQGYRPQGQYGSQGGYEQGQFGGGHGQSSFGGYGGQYGQQGQGAYGQGQFEQHGGMYGGGTQGQGGYGQGQFGQHGGMYGGGMQGQGGYGQGQFGQHGLYGRSQYGQSFRGKGPQNYKRSDERIKEEVSECLTEHHMIDASDIEVSVMNGEITLKGTVRDRQMKRLSEDAVENLSGVKEVHNQLRVQPEGKGQEGKSEEYELSGSKSGKSYRSNT